MGFYVAFNTVQVISQRVVERAEETSTYTYSSLGFCTVNCRPTASKYQLSHLRPCRESNPGLRGGRQECYHSATMAPLNNNSNNNNITLFHTTYNKSQVGYNIVVHTIYVCRNRKLDRIRKRISSVIGTEILMTETINNFS